MIPCMKMVRAGTLRGPLLLAVALALCFVGCKDKGGGETDDRDPPIPGFMDAKNHVRCNAFEAKLDSCALLSDGTFGCIEPYSLEGVCMFDCFVNAGCDHLGDLLCNDLYGSPLELCIDECLGVTSFICEDRSYSIPEEWLCDGESDCDDGSDEIDCQDFVCQTSEEVIPESWRCDDYLDCQDGSDETGCPTFTCGNGDTIPETWICDYEIDCADGSDEEQCDGFVCGDGRVIPTAWVCDFEEDCADGADEASCSGGLQCRSGEMIPESWVCDVVEDCLDGSDENNCTYFQCGDGDFIPWEWECDGEPDCSDASDEHGGCAAYLCAD